MQTKRRQHSAKIKRAVAVEMIKQEKTIAQICSQYDIHKTQASNWKNQAMEAIESGLSGNPKLTRLLKQQQEQIEELYKQVGKLKVENDWLKKKMGILE